jgi:acyl-CoA thioesterase-1
MLYYSDFLSALKIPLCLLLVSFSSQLFAANILVYGDSLSAGYGLGAKEDWPYLLTQKLQSEGYEHYKVSNASISGETSSGGLARFDKALTQYKPAIVILELGGNDGLQGFATNLLQSNLATMIEKAQRQGSSVVLAGIQIPPNYGRRYSNAFRNIYPTLQQRYQLVLIPFFLENIAGIDALMQADGIHPTAEAQPRILDNVWKKLKPLLQPAA